jgi:hypothetical protein
VKVEGERERGDDGDDADDQPRAQLVQMLDEGRLLAVAQTAREPAAQVSS